GLAWRLPHTPNVPSPLMGGVFILGPRRVLNSHSVIPAKAGISVAKQGDSRFRGNDAVMGRAPEVPPLVGRERGWGSHDHDVPSAPTVPPPAFRRSIPGHAPRCRRR